MRSPKGTLVLAFAFLLLVLAPRLAAAGTYAVTNTADSGPGSLRQAVLDANADPGSTVVFQIGSGVQKIRPLSPLGSIELGTIDGTTQPGYAGTPLIEIDGSLLPAISTCIGVRIGLIKALVVNRCSWIGIEVSDAGTVESSYIGTDPTGQGAFGNGRGLFVCCGGGTVGGSAPEEGNLISGNVYGVYLQGPGTVIGNRIGTNASGLASLANINAGIEAYAPNIRIGGASPGDGNLISGNDQYGIEVFYADDVVIQNNVIGPDASGNGTLTNQRAGILVYQSSGAIIGGPAAGNVIAHHWDAGVGVEGVSVRNRISGNSIHHNEFGIDLNYYADEQVTNNDAGDLDSGPNLLQNFPIFDAATVSGGTITVRGSLNSEPSGTYELEFFATPNPNASGHGEGESFLGSAQVTTDGAGDATFLSTFIADVSAGHVVSATATDSYGDSSEFSVAIAAADSSVQVASLVPASGSAAGGTPVTLKGAGYVSGAQVSFDDTPATSVSVSGPTEIVATAPSLGPGIVYPVIVSNTDLSTGGLADGWFADFLDVPQGYLFHAAIETLVRNHVTAGCGGGNFCPEAAGTRAEVAVLILKSALGSSYAPPPATGTVFQDVPLGSFADRWIEDAFHRGITAGCGGGNYCPANPVRRDEMAPLLLKAEHGAAYTPPMCSGIFLDVPCPSLFADWVEQLAAEGITGGCGGGNYCPSASATRGEIATFLERTFFP